MLREVSSTRRVTNPAFADDFWQVSQTEFAMQVEGVGQFYACNGNEVEYAPSAGASLESIELFLNGSVYGAILHQRNTLPLHGSSFIWKGVGIMLCGESGAGKSSLTTAFCLSGATFLTDDVTPLVINGPNAEVIPLSDRIKLWKHSLEQLNHETLELLPVLPDEEKFYLPVNREKISSFPLNIVFLIEPGPYDTIEFSAVEGVNAFAALRNQIYRWEYLPAMPESEASYLGKIISISKVVHIVQVRRPIHIPILEMKEALEERIDAIVKNGNGDPIRS